MSLSDGNLVLNHPLLSKLTERLCPSTFPALKSPGVKFLTQGCTDDQPLPSLRTAHLSVSHSLPPTDSSSLHSSAGLPPIVQHEVPACSPPAGCPAMEAPATLCPWCLMLHWLPKCCLHMIQRVFQDLLSAQEKRRTGSPS